MRDADTLDATTTAAKQTGAIRQTMTGIIVLCATGFASTPAVAVDGCLVLLCFAAPNWRAIPQCVPPIKQVLRDLARGRMFPTCAMSGPANSASHRWAQAPTYCPPQYTQVYIGDNGPVYSCDHTGAVAITVDGVPWARTWWNMSGETVTEFTQPAKTRLGTWDTQFDDDYAVWFALQPPPPPPCNGC